MLFLLKLKYKEQKAIQALRISHLQCPMTTPIKQAVMNWVILFIKLNI